MVVSLFLRFDERSASLTWFTDALRNRNGMLSCVVRNLSVFVIPPAVRVQKTAEAV
jgi:hypothetical protein